MYKRQAQEEAPQANPYASQVPHLTFDPNEPDPFQGDPFHSPEPPRAPEPPQPEPEYQQPPQNQGYGAPQYGAPPYGTGQYQPPQYTQPPQQNYYQPQYVVPQYNVPPAGYNQKSRLAAGLLGILLGTLGVHNFYLGFTTPVSYTHLDVYKRQSLNSSMASSFWMPSVPATSTFSW